VWTQLWLEKHDLPHSRQACDLLVHWWVFFYVYKKKKQTIDDIVNSMILKEIKITCFIFFLNQPIRNKDCLWRPCLLTTRDEMSNIFREPSIDSFYQVSVHLGKQFQRRRFFRNQQIRIKNCLWWPCLLMDRDKCEI
jgi:hypothetical protein